mgnify:CR=1 FL=1
MVGTGTLLADDPALTARTESGELHGQQPRPVIIGHRQVPGSAQVHQHPLHAALSEMFELGIRTVYVEGGPTLASAFIAAGVADRLYINLAPTLLGGDKLAVGDLGISTLSERIDLTITSVEQLGDDLLITAIPRAKEN